MELRTKIGIQADRIVHEQPANPFGYRVGQTFFGAGAGGAGFLAGLSSFGGGGGNIAGGGGGFFAGLGGGGGGFFDGQSSFGGGAGGSSFQAGPSFAGGGGIGALPFGAGLGSVGADGGGSDNNDIVPFDGRVPNASGSKAPYRFNHGYGRGFY